jgi:hypothetical protein
MMRDPLQKADALRGVKGWFIFVIVIFHTFHTTGLSAYVLSPVTGYGGYLGNTLFFMFCQPALWLQRHLCARPLAEAMAESDASAELLVFVVFFLAASIPFTNLVYSRISCLQAAGYVREAFLTGIAVSLVLPALTACLLAAAAGIRGVFLSFPLSRILALPAGALLVRKGTKKGYVMRPDFMELDGSFYPGPGDVIAYPVRRADDCALPQSR